MSNARAISEGDQFGLANIPFGVVSTAQEPVPRIATRLDDQVFRLLDLIDGHLLEDLDVETRAALAETTLNTFASLGRAKHRLVRHTLQKLFKTLQPDVKSRLAAYAIDVSQVKYHVPVKVGDFSDFSCSRDHVLNAGEAVLGIRQLPPGFLHFPIGYGGRSSSIVPPETPIRRPLGQFRSPEGVTFGASRAVDFELEVACVIGQPSEFGRPIDINEAEEHVFGFLLLNDWSARDIQGLEMNPLGPFNGKSFGTSISPWIVTIDALEPFRVEGLAKETTPASYLRSSVQKSHFAVRLGAAIEVDKNESVVCESRLEWLYWTIGEMIAHQTINGCPLNAGDILATGTVSGSTVDSHGCLLEITKGGKKPVALGGDLSRTYLQDGDAVRLTGVAGTRGSEEFIGFGSCYGRLQESIRFPLEQR